MRPELLSKIKKLINEGTVVVGTSPTHSPSLQNQPEADSQIEQIAKEIWGKVDGVNVKYREYGSGFIMNGVTMEEVFEIIECIR
jgi:hypothetical protein